HLYWSAKAPAALAPVPASIKKHVQFHRGFPDRLALSLRKFLSIASDLPGCRSPLCQFDISQAGREVDELVKCRELLLFRRLRFSCSGLRSAAAESLARCRYTANLTALDLYSPGVSGRGFSALVTSPHLGKLRDLAISGTEIGESQFAALTGSPRMANLE